MKRLLLISGPLLVAAGLAASCKGSDDAPASSESEGGAVTWHQDIAPLVAAKCGGCHSAGGIAPFGLETYDEAHQWGSAMNSSIQNGTMPPWGAQETDECTPPADFKDDIRLTDDEKELFARWIEEGKQEGDPDRAAALPSPPQLALEEADRQLTIPSAVTVEGTDDDFVCFTIDPGITEKVWLRNSQVQPGNDAIVHHALVFLDRDGEGETQADENGQYKCFGGPGLENPTLLSAWAPGAVPSSLPNDIGTPLNPGDRLVVQVHYHPTGQGPEEDEQTRVDLKWTTTEPDFVGAVVLIGNFDEVGETIAGGDGFGLTSGPEFLIPAGEEKHTETSKFRLPGAENELSQFMPLRLWMVGTHMHYVGTDMKITATNSEGEEQCLVQTPNWDFNWQRGYFFEADTPFELPEIYAGDILSMRCTYNNSLSNPFVRDALASQGLETPLDVHMGDETLDEMCLGLFGLAVPKQYASVLGL